MQKRLDRESCTPVSLRLTSNKPPSTNTIRQVTRGDTRSIVVFVAAVLAALSFAACGSSGSSDSSSTSGASTPTEKSAQNGDAESGSQGEGESQGQSGSQDKGDAGGQGSQEQQSASTGFTRAEVETPLKVSGGGSDQFRTKGGDNSIQEFGEERDESELQEAAEVVHSFFVARAAGEWDKACSYLSKAISQQLEQLAASSTELKDKGCAPFLSAFTSHLSAAEWQGITTVDAGSLRTEGEQAFLIYFGPDKTVYAMPLAVEDGQFKVGALAGNALS